MSEFKPRTTKPKAGNKYYITKARGGYSGAIQGKPTDPDCDVLSNCVGYAVGRFNEIGGYGCCKYLSPVNAENFIQYAGGLEVGQTPKLGACMVWKKGETLSNSDGAGHVAIVEKIISDTQIVTSESGWGSSAFWTKTRNKGNGNWGAGSGYTFLGFIYNPAPCCTSTNTPTTGNAKEENTVKVEMNVLRKGSKGEQVKTLQRLLLSLGYGKKVPVFGKYGADGSFGSATDKAVREFQKANGLSVDGSVGQNTWNKLLKG